MKSSKIILLSCLFVLFGSLSVFAHGPSTSPSKTESLATEISSLMSDIDLSTMPYDSQRLHIQFIVNNDNEIVVIDVSDANFKAQILSRLNYQELTTAGIEKNKLFLIPVSLQRK